MTRSIYFDESGYTGPALLDGDQPYFGVASSLIEDEDAEGILRRAFPKYRGEEFKFTNLWTKPRSRAALPALVSELTPRRDDFFLFIIDKRFCVLTKLIDFLVEPVAHAAGRDFYRDSHASKYANYVHWGFTAVDNEALYESTVRAYYRFVRAPDEPKLAALQQLLVIMANSAPEEMRFFYEVAAEGALRFHEFWNIETFADTFEIQLTSVLNSVGYWRNKLPDNFEMFHDASNNFFAQKELWDAITADHVPAQLHPQAFGPAIEFPLRVRGTHAVDSKRSFAVQLCDAIAGLATRCVRPASSPEEAKFYQSLLDGGLGEWSLGGVNPGTEFPDGGPPELDGPDAVDQLLAIVKSGRAPQG